MFDTRWIKLLRDLTATPWRIAVMLMTIAVGIFAFTALLSSYSLLSREVRNNYLATNPAAAHIHVDRIDAALLTGVRNFPGVQGAQAGATYKTNVTLKDGTTQPLIIFLVEDFTRLKINRLTPATGAWPPSPNSLLLERDNLKRKKIGIGDHLNIPSPDGSMHAISVSGALWDPAMPVPSYAVYGYTTADTLAAIGIDAPLTDLSITFADKNLSNSDLERAASQLALWIQAKGYKVSHISVPPMGEHPHQRIIFSVLGIFLLFSAIAFGLSITLNVIIIDGMMAQQRRQIGIMKAIGASNAQMAALYLGFMFLLSALAVAIGMPAGISFGQAFSKMILGFLNFELQNPAVPYGIYCVIIATAILLPLLSAAIPIITATQNNPLSSLNYTGTHQRNYSSAKIQPWLHLPGLDPSLMMALRNSFRRRGRLLLILSLLASGGAMFIGSLNLQQAAQQHLAEAADERRYDLEIFLLHANDSTNITRVIRGINNVTTVEPWATHGVVPYRPDGLIIDSTYSDGGHGLLTLKAMPENSQSLRLKMEQGQWPTSIPEGKVILNRSALESFPQVKIGNTISINALGQPLQLDVIGIAEQKMSGRTMYVSASTYEKFFAKGSDRSYRIALKFHDATSIEETAKHIERLLTKEHIQVNYIITETVLRREIDAHFTMLVHALRFISILTAIVGALALASVMSMHVAERTREIGIMRSIGASSATIGRNIIIEGVCIGVIGWIFAIILSIPLSKIASNYIGNIVFDEPFPLSISLSALAIWFLFTIAGAILASLYPTKRATQLSIHDCFAHQ